MNTLTRVAVATCTVAAVSVSIYALSQPVSASRADDAPTTSQSYTAPDASSPVVRDTPTATPAPVVVQGSDTDAPTVAPEPGSAASIPIPAPVVATFPDLTLAPCATEDSHNCYWDASRMGNGIGESFIDWNGVTYRASK
jgi:hypothetical protein